MKSIQVLLLFSYLSLISPSWAANSQPNGTPSGAPSSGVKEITKKSELHKFSGLRLKGQLKKPEMSYIYQRKGLRAEKIINIPEDFNAEIIQGSSQF